MVKSYDHTVQTQMTPSYTGLLIGTQLFDYFLQPFRFVFVHILYQHHLHLVLQNVFFHSPKNK